MKDEMQPVLPPGRFKPSANGTGNGAGDATGNGGGSGGGDDHDEPADAGTPPADPTPPRRTVQEFARANWLLLVIGLVVLLFACAFFYARSVSQSAEGTDEDPVAAASDNLDTTISKPAPAAASNPVDVIEQKKAAEERAKAGGATPETTVTADELAANMVVDTVGQAAAQRRAREQKLAKQQVQQQAAAATARRAASIPPPDSTEVTTRDNQTGAYRSRRVAVSRRSNAASNGDVRRRLREEVRPRVAPDGTPYEQNDDVLDMLDASPPAARVTYEQMTGKRYFDRRAIARAKGPQALVGAADLVDPFGTIKAGGYNYNGASNQDQGTTQLLPDIFYKCVVNGPQTIRTGSVVYLRLAEDAIISGHTFPKNLVFAGIASVETNRVTIEISRLGPTRVSADICDYNYLAGIMIDPAKKQPVEAGNSPLNDARMMGSQEIGTAIDRSASAANSVVGVAGRIGTSMVSRLGSSPRRRLRDVLLPDGYPVLITTGATDAAASANQ